ncbi:aminodeoxychorismate/anthranilate synthase component II [Zavarzinia compransoris]|uniref:anthranilate synthase component II n=1 Tax=Zavarzinia marina TaxID=2911065 RepID=UPI001F18A762|nr:aminodeoxychorismate/anthranilate synthase component II [Zavarzinia marina]MCF4165560.1 aminodeoxychorismate/anthranilate synthase component II [Zavarzinia marina]
MILVIDNYDSFVFNVARYLTELGAEVRVLRNDTVTPAAVEAMAPRALVISPGPLAPDRAGVSLDLVRAFSGRLPILGVCLGHQCVGQAFGGRVVRARRPLHGQATPVAHDGTGLFAGLPAPLTVGRYHSLVVELSGDEPLTVTATSAEGEVMALAHAEHPTFGVQFHPESILTEGGHGLLRNFLERAA